jgi:hypothetical protein
MDSFEYGKALSEMWTLGGKVSTAEEYWSAWRSEIGAAGVRPLELGDRY